MAQTESKNPVRERYLKLLQDLHDEMVLSILEKLAKTESPETLQSFLTGAEYGFWKSVGPVF